MDELMQYIARLFQGGAGGYTPQTQGGTNFNAGQQYGMNAGMGGTRNASGPQAYNQFGQPINTPGMFQGGTSNQRAGGQQGGMVGSPDLGTASELMRWASQVPNGMQQLQQMGMAPQISSSNVRPIAEQIAGRGGASWNAQAGTWEGGTPTPAARDMWLSQNRPNAGGPSGSSPNSAQYQHVLGMQGQGGQMGQQGQPQFGGQGASIPENSGFERDIESQIKGIFDNPSGMDRQALHTRAGDAAAGQQRISEERTREDAVRRGASTSAGGDSDIRSELNRVGMQGAQNQEYARQDVDKMIAQIGGQNRQGALGAGLQLTGQRRDSDNRRAELEMILAQMQQQQGPMGGLSAIFGGR